MSGQRCLVVIPTYDEVQNIELTIDRVRASVPAADVLVVDDTSPDGTGELADKIARHDSQVHVLHRTEKLGLGKAYLEGFAWALGQGYDLVVQMDADGSHLPEQLPRLLSAVADADLVVGARWIPGGRVVNWSKRRQLLSRGGNGYARLVLGLSLHDATGGYRVFRRETLLGLDLATVSSEGYCFQVDLARRTVEAGYRVVEVPITFVDRTYGNSKMTGVIVREALVKVTAWGVQRRLDGIRSLVSRHRDAGRV